MRGAPPKSEEGPPSKSGSLPPSKSGSPLNNPSKNQPSKNDVVDEETKELCDHLAARLAAHSGREPKISKAWYSDMDLLLRRGCQEWAQPDEVPARHVRLMIDFIFDHPGDGGFSWADNIRSPGKLRKQWDKLRVWRNKQVKPKKAGLEEGTKADDSMVVGPKTRAEAKALWPDMDDEQLDDIYGREEEG